MPASNGASPDIASTRKVLKAARAIMAGARTPYGSPSRRSKGQSVCVSRPQTPQAHLPGAVDFSGLNAAVREFGLTYSRFIDGIGKAGVMSIARCFRILLSGSRRVPSHCRQGQGRTGGLTPGSGPVGALRHSSLG